MRVDHRKISAVRNTGASLARGEGFFFVDADTQINALAVSAGCRHFGLARPAADVGLNLTARSRCGDASFIALV